MYFQSFEQKFHFKNILFFPEIPQIQDELSNRKNTQTS